MYARLFKRFFDFILSLIALIVLSPLLVILMIAGAIAMRGNPFFTQLRPGKDEKIFKLIKFRTMSNAKGKDGNLLPDHVRLNNYGRFLRSTSMDELPELLNIFLGNMSIIGPRPLLPEYLPYYTEQEHHRHDVRPGLTGLAQVNGRSFITWEEIFSYDLQYVENITFITDVKIVVSTVMIVLGRQDVADLSNATMGKDGKRLETQDGKNRTFHRPLNVERSECALKK